MIWTRLQHRPISAPVDVSDNQSGKRVPIRKALWRRHIIRQHEPDKVPRPCSPTIRCSTSNRRANIV